jgi:hypothetical protein
MKTIITLTFLLFSFLGFSQTTREEVVKRTEGGHKLIVNTYSGTGNSERLIKKTFYKEDNSIQGYGNSSFLSVSLKPISIRYYGSFKEEITYLSNTSYHEKGYVETSLCFGEIKIESFNKVGNLVQTWKITDYSSELTSAFELDGKSPYAKRVYTLVP